jgi:glycosyltransferase involved in cell wall biosynthesis
MPEVSIIIPTLNEEDTLPFLLDSLHKQTFQDFEVIVADAGSEHNTVNLVKGFAARVVPGGSPGAGRNSGAAIAQGDYLFFLDADVVLPVSFLEEALAEWKDEQFDLATCEFLPDSTKNSDAVIYGMANAFVRLSLKLDPHAAGFCLFTKKTVFESIGGFDESLALAEDHDFVKRASKEFQFGFLERPKLRVSVRRLDKEGRLRYSWKCLQVEFYRMFHGEPTEKIVEYNFADYDQETKKFTEATYLALKEKYKDLEREVKIWFLGLKAMKPAMEAKGAKLLKNFRELLENIRSLFIRNP